MVLPKQNLHLLLQPRQVLVVSSGYMRGEHTYLHLLFYRYSPFEHVAHPLDVSSTHVLQV